jgi:hypothetical protein
MAHGCTTGATGLVVAAAEKGETGSERAIDPPGPEAGHGRCSRMAALCALLDLDQGVAERPLSLPTTTTSRECQLEPTACLASSQGTQQASRATCCASCQMRRRPTPSRRRQDGTPVCDSSQIRLGLRGARRQRGRRTVRLRANFCGRPRLASRRTSPLPAAGDAQHHGRGVPS